MKKQTVRDRMNEGEGMVKHHMKMETERHGQRIHHESAMHEHQTRGGKADYRNEVEEPKLPKMGHMEKGMGMHDFKGEAYQIAYGQAGKEGCKSDMQKINSQMKNYHWGAEEGGASGY